MDKSMNNIHVFHTVVLVLKQMNVDVEKYIEASASEGLRVEVCIETSGSGMECLHESANLSKILNKSIENNEKLDAEGTKQHRRIPQALWSAKKKRWGFW